MVRVANLPPEMPASHGTPTPSPLRNCNPEDTGIPEELLKERTITRPATNWGIGGNLQQARLCHIEGPRGQETRV